MGVKNCVFRLLRADPISESGRRSRCQWVALSRDALIPIFSTDLGPAIIVAYFHDIRYLAANPVTERDDHVAIRIEILQLGNQFSYGHNDIGWKLMGRLSSMPILDVSHDSISISSWMSRPARCMDTFGPRRV